MKIKWFSSKNNLCEIYQQVNVQFAFLSPENMQCHDWIKCRDFLHDAVKAHLNKIKWQIYGFVYEYGVNPPIDMKHMKMLMRKPAKGKKAEKEFKDIHTRALALLHHYEDMMGISKSEIVETEDQNGYPAAIYIGDPIWMCSPFLVSAYTFFMRMGDKDISFTCNKSLMSEYEKVIKNGAKDNDTTYLKAMWNKLDIVFKNTDKLFGKKKIHPLFMDEKTPTGTFHDTCGIYSLCAYRSPDKKGHEFIQGEMKRLKRS